MAAREKMIAIYVPASLIPGFDQHVGPVLFYMDRLRVEDGFALAENEYVTTLERYAEACKMAGVYPDNLAIITKGIEPPTE
ncbi:hypothetical protein [Enterobacter sp.]|uniref:hypothetical protein n=1 Tax=Enterobacter sp. TaxID=42895 RepID=UPI003D0A65B8